jgi:FlaG/FlaF family flagellin (archaellin)
VWSNGKRRLQPSAGRTSQTNDLGQFRLYGLPPGDYYVSATLRGGADFMVMDMAMAATTTGAGPAPSGSTPRSGYAPTYFPGTTLGAEAQKITLTAGQETQGTDFALLPVKLAKITGTVIGSDGKPVSGSMINALPRGGGESAMFFGLGQGSARTDKNGNFTMNNVAPGDYTLQTRAIQIMSTSGADGGTMMFTARIGGPGGGGDAESGAVPVSISGEDLTNVIIVTSKGATATGKITYEGGTPPASAGMIRINAVPTDSDGGPTLGGGSATAKPDGTFEVSGVSGSRIFRVTGFPQGWIL